MNLNEMAEEIHNINKTKGFWQGTHCSNEECGARSPRNPYQVLSLIMTEVAEAIEALRDCPEPGKQLTSWHSGPNTNSPELEIDSDGVRWVSVNSSRQVQVTDEMLRGWGYIPKPEGVPSELADVIIRTLDACAAWGIDIQKAVDQKLAYNVTRPHKHGRLA